jgi:hypothetical protein
MCFVYYAIPETSVKMHHVRLDDGPHYFWSDPVFINAVFYNAKSQECDSRGIAGLTVLQLSTKQYDVVWTVTALCSHMDECIIYMLSSGLGLYLTTL